MREEEMAEEVDELEDENEEGESADYSSEDELLESKMFDDLITEEDMEEMQRMIDRNEGLVEDR